MLRIQIALPLLLIATPARPAVTFQDTAALDRQVAAALGAGIGEPGGAATAIDQRLKLAACPAVTVEPAIAGAATVRCATLGWRLRVPIARGASTPAATIERAARAEPVVRRGDPVEMAVETGAFTVSMQAVAEQDGGPGDRIRVRADARSAPRYAEVVDAGRVRIAGFK